MSVQATFGAGCFWGTEKYFKKQFGGKITDVFVGYMGGALADPTYRQVCSGTTNHAEVLTFKFNPAEVPFKDLLQFFFRMHDVTTVNRQQGDVGTQYRSAVFYHNEEQKLAAEEAIHALNTTTAGDKLRSVFGAGAKVVTTVEPAGHFWKAEDYHQQYLDQNPSGYCTHRIYW